MKIRLNLKKRNDKIVPTSASPLSAKFDLEILVSHLKSFKFQNGKLFISRTKRIEWENAGVKEFNEYFEHVCQLPHVQKYVDENSTSDLLPHNSQLVYSKLKSTLKKWCGKILGEKHMKLLKLKKGGNVINFKSTQLTGLAVILKELCKTFFQLQFSSGETIEAFRDGESLIKLFYTNTEIY